MTNSQIRRMWVVAAVLGVAAIVVVGRLLTFQMFQGESSQPAITSSHTSVTGMKIFHPRRMIWS